MLKTFTISLLMVLAAGLHAAAGDTIRVSTHNKVVIKTNPSVGSTWYGGWGKFPSASVPLRRIFLDLTFECAPGLKCGEWDYINQIFIGKKGGVKGDSLGYEISRFITPYGFYWNASQNWKHSWRIDVTDFESLLRDSVQIWYMHSGYEGNTDRGWQITLNFNCVEGTPLRKTIGLERLFSVSAPYGSQNDPIKNYLPDKSISQPKASNLMRIKIIQTGHGMDQQENCSEFCKKELTVKLNDSTVLKRLVWRDNCGWNSLYPQAGTWLYDRANWCPGAPVEPYDIDVWKRKDSVYKLDMNMQAYTNTAGGSANYVITAYAIYYLDTTDNYEDATLLDIVAPSNEYEYNRYNPICARPVIRVQNNGINEIKHLGVRYGVKGNLGSYFDWHGLIKPGEKADVELLDEVNWSGGSNLFEAEITAVNYTADNYTGDNRAQSVFTTVPVVPNDVYIYFKSNAAASENFYTVTDATGNVISSKGSFTNNTVYRDTLKLQNNMCYTFDFEDSGPAPASNPLNKDGLDWWANTADGSGVLVLRNTKTGGTLKNFPVDFGTKILYQFIVGYKMGIQDTEVQALGIRVFPNPSAGRITLSYDVPESFEDTYAEVIDAMGRQVFKQKIEPGYDGSLDIDLSGNAAGLYAVILNAGTHRLVKKVMLQ